MDKRELITIRNVKANDVNFIFSTWLRGLRYGLDWFELIESSAYYTNYELILKKLLSKPGVEVLVAVLKDDPDAILGYSVFEGDILHWVFCKKAWRNIGIAKNLVPPNLQTVTHVTKIGVSIMKKLPNVTFNPFKI